MRHAELSEIAIRKWKNRYHLKKAKTTAKCHRTTPGVWKNIYFSCTCHFWYFFGTLPIFHETIEAQTSQTYQKILKLRNIQTLIMVCLFAISREFFLKRKVQHIIFQISGQTWYVTQNSLCYGILKSPHKK